jgi:hypothetical protein
MKSIILCISIILVNSLKLRNSISTQEDDKDKNPEKVPIINVHMEEPDRDPIEVKRIEEERRIERNRIREMEIMEELDKRQFQQIIALQNSQLGKLTKIADKTSQLLNKITTKDSSSGGGTPPPSFKQKDTYTTVFDDMVNNGPINLS